MISYTSKQANSKRLKIYLAITIFCGIFSVIYEHFSHQVYSFYMIFMFMIPLLFGVLPEILYKINPKFDTENWTQKVLRAFGVATLTVGFCLQGIVEIYGTTSQFILWYFVAGAGMILLSVISRIKFYA